VVDEALPSQTVDEVVVSDVLSWLTSSDEADT
jgi:hypothetical protein